IDPSRFGIATAAFNGKVYAIGGMERNRPPNVANPGDLALDFVQEYDPDADKWTDKKDMMTARLRVSASTVDGKVYVFGGSQQRGGQALDIVEVYDLMENSWKRSTRLPTAIAAMTTATVDGKIYVIGGWDQFLGRVYSSVFEFDPGSGKFTKKRDMPTARGGLGSAVFKGKIYTFGGELTAPMHLMSLRSTTPRPIPGRPRVTCPLREGLSAQRSSAGESSYSVA
ncbi:MAG: hypothetical protein O7E52_16355, partial [Candidatus Poribacteria bacterium]|nr:hypothetical protein [Candidatus Poribacteria bacterium]